MSRMLVIFLTLVGAVAFAADAPVSRLRLRTQATIYQGSATLADVLVLGEAEPELAAAISDQPVFAVRTPAASAITHAQVLRRLEELGVNLAHVLLSGASKCELTVARDINAEAASGGPVEIVRTTATKPGPRQETAAAGERSLADVLRGFVENELKDLGGTVELQFDRAGQEYLQLTTPPFEFNVSGSGQEKLGLREFRIVVRQNGRTQRTVQVFAQVRLARPVVVAKRPLSIGNFIRPDDVAVETRVFDAARELGLGDVGQAIGQQIKQYVPAGGLVSAGQLKPVDLVQRSRPVTVLGANANVQVRLTGVALDAGAYGDTVRVRLGEGRGKRQEVRGIVTGMGTVRMTETTP